MASKTETTDAAAEVVADGVLSVKDAIAFTNLSQAELYRRMSAGTLAFVKIGVRRMIPKRALVQLLASNLSPVVAATG